MYQTIIEYLKQEARDYASIADVLKVRNRPLYLQNKYRTQQMTYLSAIDILRLIDGQDLRMNQGSLAK